jgi:hypothetical protein
LLQSLSTSITLSLMPVTWSSSIAEYMHAWKNLQCTEKCILQ